ncbi:MAG TPA: peptidylprolyl isomerase [Acidobacteriaceae bacterium]|nr:peptidylprolyl isomerase [Acidobacteriaceae bacterium]
MDRVPRGAIWISAAVVVCAMAVPATEARAQQQPAEGSAQPGIPAGAGASATGGSASAGGAGQEVTLDTVAAIVNGDLILESDVEAERRFAAFQPFSEAKPLTDDELLNRLIDRTLIIQQMAIQPGAPITDDAVNAELSALRTAIPRCAAYHCQTDAGWAKFVADQGFTMEELRERWRQRMEVLRFIEERFRMGIRISQGEIADYYKTQMLPAYAKENAQAPPEATVADRIQEILLQQRVDKLLDDWLTALRAQGDVRILKPGEEAP